VVWKSVLDLKVAMSLQQPVKATSQRSCWFRLWEGGSDSYPSEAASHSSASGCG